MYYHVAALAFINLSLSAGMRVGGVLPAMCYSSRRMGLPILIFVWKNAAT